MVVWIVILVFIFQVVVACVQGVHYEGVTLSVFFW